MNTIEESDLYSADLAPVPAEHRTWTVRNLAALWVGMAVCIPTYLLASYMMRAGLLWYEALIIIGLANIVITIPMVLNGHAGVKYGIPFPVFGRVAFGTAGIHLPALLRGFVACGWFGIQTWIGGLAIYSIANVITGTQPDTGITLGKVSGFLVFWLMNMYFIHKGTESIRWLEDLAAPILILIGLLLVYWGWAGAGSFGAVLDKSNRLGQATLIRIDENTLKLNLLPDAEGKSRASDWCYWNASLSAQAQDWQPLPESMTLSTNLQNTQIAFRSPAPHTAQGWYFSRALDIPPMPGETPKISKFWEYLIWFTSMVGFWATMSISISDITRFAKTSKDQIAGQFLGLPGTMIFYSFVGIFVTAAAVLIFPDILISEDAPWDPVTLMDHFSEPWVIILAQIFMLIATLSTNIAANVIAPAYAISNVFPKKLSFRTGGYIAGVTGILLCPWWLMDEVSNLLIFISGLLGPVLAVLLCDYFLIRKTQLAVDELFTSTGRYGGIKWPAIWAFLFGALAGLSGKWISALEPLYHVSWFTAFGVAFVTYYLLARNLKPEMR
jgi:cytosine/uracil/thiamine/allantoin permease